MSVTHPTLRKALAYALDDLAIVTTTSVGTTTTFVALALQNATPNASANLMNGDWAYQATGAGMGSQARVRPGGLNPTTGTGTIYPVWSAPASGVDIWLTSLFPCIASAISLTPGQETDYRTILTRALDRYPVPDQILLPTVAGQSGYSLAAYAAWISRERITSVLGPPLVTGYPPQDDTWRVDSIRTDNGAPTLYLRAPWAGVGETARLDVVRPASTLVNGAESTTGLVNETDTVVDQVRIEDFLPLALEEAYTVLANRGVEGRPWAKLAADLKPQNEARIARLERRARGLPEAAPVQEAA